MYVRTAYMYYVRMQYVRMYGWMHLFPPLAGELTAPHIVNKNTMGSQNTCTHKGQLRIYVDNFTRKKLNYKYTWQN